MTLKSRGAIPLYYEFLYGIGTLNPFRVHFVLKVVVPFLGLPYRILNIKPQIGTKYCGAYGFRAFGVLGLCGFRALWI